MKKGGGLEEGGRKKPKQTKIYRLPRYPFSVNVLDMFLFFFRTCFGVFCFFFILVSSGGSRGVFFSVCFEKFHNLQN